jgi:hypothetical protein
VHPLLTVLRTHAAEVNPNNPYLHFCIHPSFCSTLSLSKPSSKPSSIATHSKLLIILPPACSNLTARLPNTHLPSPSALFLSTNRLGCRRWVFKRCGLFAREKDRCIQC